MTYYSKPIKQPATRKEGLLNFVQMIINRIEAEDHREALMLAVDLLDTLAGNANPYADVTDGISRPAMDAELKALSDLHREQMATHGQRMFDKGQEAAKADMARLLGLAA